LQAIVDGFEGFVYICSADNRLEFVNERLRRHLGRDPVGELCHQAVHGSPAPCRWCANGAVVGGQTVRREVFNPNDQRWYYSVLSPLVHPDGRVSKHGIMLDITSREQARRDLAAQEAMLRSVLSSLPAHIAVLNPAGFIIAVNQAWEEFGRAAGMTASQVGVGVNYLQVLAQATTGDQTAAQALDGIQAVLEGRRDSYQQEYPCHAPDGSQHWFLMTVSPLERSRGGVVISHMEVTERVRAEQALRESRTRYRNLVAQLPLAVAIVQDGRIVFANSQAADVFGLPDPGALLGSDPLEHVAPGERPRMVGVLQAMAGTDAAATHLEAMLRRADGVEFPAEIHGARLEYGDRPAVQLVINDITERRQAQETIGVLARILEESPNPVLRVTSQGQLLYANPTAQKLLTSWGLQVGGETPPNWLPALEEAIAQGDAQRYETRQNGRHLVFVLAPVPESGYLNLYGMDVTEIRQYEQRLAASEANYRAVFNSVGDAIFIHDVQDGSILDVNQAAVDLYGYSPEEARRLNVEALSAGPPHYGQEQALEMIMRAVAGQPQVFEWQARKKDGSLFWAEVSLKRARIGEHDRLLSMVRDITERRQAQEQIQLLAKVFENTIEGISVTDTRGTIQMVNPGFTHITGYSAEEVLGRNPRVLKSDRHDAEFYAAMWRDIVENGHWSGEIWNRRKSGEAYPEWLTISVIKDAAGEPTHYVAVFHDITEIKRSEEQIRHQAYHDALTGLPNRQLFNDRLEMALSRARRGGESLAVVFLDLDHFKTINDSLGHAVGDLLLQEVAQRLKRSVRQEDTVCRLGGDEFIMILPELGEVDQAVAVAGRIIEDLEKPFSLRGHELYITCSIGITIYPNDGDDLETLVKNADMAMYRAKEQGRNTYRLFTPAMNQRARQRQEMLSALRRAVERDEFLVHYQPQVDLFTEQVVGIEALVRWRPPSGEMIPPDQFIPLAEETGLILSIGQKVLEAACRQTAEWARQGHYRLRLAVNLSARQFNQPDLVERIAGVLEQTGLAPAMLELEITESTAMANLDATSGTLRRLHALGLTLSLDDFGTGYSSLNYLRRFAIDLLKIDRSFIKDLPSDSDAATITEAIVSMAHTLRLKVIAEGVETREQLNFLRNLGCDYVQGFLYSRPLPAEELAVLLRAGKLTPKD
ncbi:MAG: PAS domain S-box protein, partial [Desulfarculus sp.]|nr:PAS domain S-box protein [Desulfarculus sp.]